MLQKEHLCWQQVVRHERRDTFAFNEHNPEKVYNFEEIDKQLDMMHALKAKKELFGKHLARYMPEVVPLSQETIDRLPLEHRGTAVLSPDYAVLKKDDADGPLNHSDMKHHSSFTKKLSSVDPSAIQAQATGQPLPKYLSRTQLKYIQNKQLNHFSPLPRTGFVNTASTAGQPLHQASLKEALRQQQAKLASRYKEKPAKRESAHELPAHAYSNHFESPRGTAAMSPGAIKDVRLN